MADEISPESTPAGTPAGPSAAGGGPRAEGTGPAVPEAGGGPGAPPAGEDAPRTGEATEAGGEPATSGADSRAARTGDDAGGSGETAAENAAGRREPTDLAAGDMSAADRYLSFGTGRPAPGGGGDPDDPFAGLQLDESFVRAASVYEAPARTRAAVRRHGVPGPAGQAGRRRGRAAATPPSPRDWSPAGPGRRRRRGLLVGVAVGLVAAVAVGYLTGLPALRDGRGASSAAAPPTPSPSPGGSAGPIPFGGAGLASSPAPSTDVLLDLRTYQRGACYTWDQDRQNSQAESVPCAQEHLFEAVVETSLSRSEFPLGAAFPTPDEWDAIGDRYCRAGLAAFLGYPLDPHGIFTVGTIHPADGWGTGDRKLVCGFTHAWYEANPPRDRFKPFTGRVEGADQSWIYPTGACLEGDRHRFLGTIPCDQPHSEVVIGATTLPGAPGSPAPSDDAFADLAQPRCDAMARDYLGPSFRPSATVWAGWLNIAPESWAAGSHSTNCLVFFTTSSNEPRKVTGELARVGQGVPA